MKPTPALRSGLLLLCATLPATAVTETWDGNAPNGGAGDSNISTGLNWADDSAPLSDLNNTDLIFGGTTKLAPNFFNSLNARSVTFNNTAGLFVLGGQSLSVGTGGIVNNDTSLQTFNNPVSFAGVANAAVSSGSGPLTFTNTVTLPSATLTVNTTQPVNLSHVSGTGTLAKNGNGSLTLSPNVAQSFDLFVSAGNVIANGTLFDTFDANASVTVVNGNFVVPAGETVSLNNTPVALQSGGNLAVTGRLNVSNGADISKTGDWAQSSFTGEINVTGNGSTLSSTGVHWIWGTGAENQNLHVRSGGDVTGGGLNLFSSAISVDGAGSTLTSNGTTVIYYAGISFSNGAGGALGDVAMGLFNGPDLCTFSVQSGATLTTGNINLSNLSSGAAPGILTVSGTGSTITQNGVATLGVGASPGQGTLNVTSGGRFTTGTGNVSIAGQGVVNLNGGSLAVRGPLSVTGGGTLNFTAGSLSLVDNFTVGAGGLFGMEFTLGPAQTFSTSGSTGIEAFSVMNLNGGTFSSSALTNNGTLAFNSGTLAITGPGGFTIGSGGALGANVSLGGDTRLQVTNTAGVTGGAVFTLEGGLFTAGALSNSGTVRVNSGIAAAASANNNNSGRIFIADLLEVSGIFTNAAGARITLQDGAGLLSGVGVLNNSGLLTGDGAVLKPLANSATGEVRGEAGRTLYFATAAVNQGQLTLAGGTLEFQAAVTNSATGFISGHGSLYTGGLTNSGQMAFAGDVTDVRGDVTLTPGARVVTSGAGSVTAFYDDVVHNGQEIYTGAGAGTVFYGAQSGSGAFTGSGTVYYTGDLRPGNSPAVVSYAPQVVFTPFHDLTMEIGGRTAGAGTPPNNGYDKLVFTHASAPQVTWNGTLVIELINGFSPAAGDVFDLFDFAAGRIAGTFSSVVVHDNGLMPAGLSFDFSQLYTTGQISVTAAPGLTFPQWAASVLGDAAALAGGDHDLDGYDNSTEYALGLFPPFPGTTPPAGGLHVYAEGERMRLTFWRPLDRADVTLRVQVSGDLISWSDLAVSVNSAPFTGAGFVSENRAHPPSEPGLVEVRDILNASAAGRRYVRLLVTLTP